MRRDLALVLLYTKPNRYSINALVGALEADRHFDNLPVHCPKHVEALRVALAEVVPRHERVVLGISLGTPQVPAAGELLRELRQRYGAALFTVAGGPHPSGDPEGTLALGFDVVVCGEGEAAFGELLHALDDRADFAGVAGLAYRGADGSVRQTPRRAAVDLNRYPPFGQRHRKRGPLEITRGCPFACRFCQTSYFLGGKVRHRDLDTVCHYVEDLLANHFEDIRIITPNALSYGSPDGRELNLSAVEALLVSLRRLLGPRRRLFFGSFPSEVRPEHVTAESVALIRRYADNDNLILGVQSGSDRMLEACNRGHTAGEALRAVNVARAAGFGVNTDFIFGLPGETADDLRQTLDLMERLVGLGARIHAHRFVPLPQTPWADELPQPLAPELVAAIEARFPPGVIYGGWKG